MADVVAAIIATLLAATETTSALPALAPAVALGAVALAKLGGLYDRDRLVMRRSTVDDVPSIVQLSGLVALLAVGLAGTGFLPVDALYLWLTLAGSQTVSRAGARWATRRLLPSERSLAIGDLEIARRIGEKVVDSRASARIVAVIPMRPGDHADVFGGAEGLRGLVAAERIDRILLVPVTADATDTLELVRVAKLVGVRVSILPRLFEVVGSRVEFEDIGGLTVLGVRPLGLSRMSRLVKRGFDLMGATIALVATSPIMLLAALAIRLDSRGPVFFRQVRVGRDGKHFRILKFRTMILNAERVKDELRDRNETQGLFKIVKDPRITRVGRLLRATSLDELPQLINVLRGDMSLVGPRPLVVDEDSRILGLDRARLNLTPGMTGHWQILGSGRVPMKEMVSIDYVYVNNWTLWTDIKLLLRTVSYVLGRGGI